MMVSVHLMVARRVEFARVWGECRAYRPPGSEGLVAAVVIVGQNAVLNFDLGCFSKTNEIVDFHRLSILRPLYLANMTDPACSN